MNSDVSSEHEDEIVRLLVNRGVDGLILVTAHELDADEQLVESLSTLPVPLVMVDRFIDGVACDRVRFDSELGGFLATDCLLQHGHTRIACLVNTSSHTGRARLTGYRRALESHGVAADDALVFESDYYIADGAAATERVLESLSLIHICFQALVRSSDMRNLRFYQPHQKHSASKRLKPPPKFALYSIRDDV